MTLAATPTGRTAGGSTFRAEATLSLFELDGQQHFTLILRNVDERLEAERRILSRIVLPSAMLGIWDSLRISLGWAWTWLVVAELVAGGQRRRDRYVCGL